MSCGTIPDAEQPPFTHASHARPWEARAVRPSERRGRDPRQAVVQRRVRERERRERLLSVSLSWERDPRQVVVQRRVREGVGRDYRVCPSLAILAQDSRLSESSVSGCGCVLADGHGHGHPPLLHVGDPFFPCPLPCHIAPCFILFMPGTLVLSCLLPGTRCRLIKMTTWSDDLHGQT